MRFLRQPDIDPVLIHLWGPLQVRWYSLLYVGGFIVGSYILRKLSRENRYKFTATDVERLIVWFLLGAVIGARIVYCVVYDPKNLLQDPLYLFQVYRGGLSFHGGLLGVMTAALFYCRKHGIPFWNLCDAMALSAPVGLGMGRIGNFINGELFGRISYVPWAMIFREGGTEPRHPSQLYEFFLEGVGLFAVLWALRHRLKHDGQIAFVFGAGYCVARFVVEFFREPDAHIGYLFLGLTMGQILSLVSIAIIAVLWKYCYHAIPVPETATRKPKRWRNK
jgi:phosphatidylglycerol:prolipoprotein diacylglycerol transferase